MGTITKIQSVSDIITNSSSEVFVMHESDAKYYDGLNTNSCVSITPITMEWLRSWDGMNEWEMVCNICHLDSTEIRGTFITGQYYSYYEGPNEDEWEVFLELHKDVIEERIKDLYWVDIEDHFSDAEDVLDSARDDSIWKDYRH